jgi:hypothetical protein
MNLKQALARIKELEGQVVPLENANPPDSLQNNYAIFCEQCGARKISHSTGRFDSTTGKPVFEFLCMNSRGCSQGCRNAGTHRTGFISGNCPNCGHNAECQC